MTRDELQELNAFAGTLEHELTELIDKIVNRDQFDGHTEDELKRIVLFGDAIRAIKENIEFRKRVDL